MAIDKTRVVNIETGKATNNVKTLKQQIKELREAMAGMEQGSKEWEQASAKLGEALHKQQEIGEAGKRAMNDFGQTMSNLAGVGAGVAAGINGITSALSLMGVEVEKDDVGMIKFTQSMMAIVQALSTVDTATKAWDGLMTSLNAMLDQKIADTAATEANTLVTDENTVASTKNAAAKKGQAAAAGENATAMTAEGVAADKASKGVGGLSGMFGKLAKALKMSKAALGAWAIAITAVITAVSLLVKHMNKLDEQKNYMVDLGRKSADAYNSAAVELEVYNNVLHDSNQTYEARLYALNKLKEAFPGYEAQLTKEGQLLNDNNQILTANIELMKLRAATNVYLDEYMQNLKDINDLEKENEDQGKGWFNEAMRSTLRGMRIQWLDVYDAVKIYNRETDIAEKNARNNQIMEKLIPGLVSQMGALETVTKTTFRNMNSQISQTRENLQSTARTLQVLLNTYLNQYSTFENNNIETALEKFVNTVENALTTAGETSGKVLGEGILESFKESLENTPSIFERFSKRLSGYIDVALNNANGNAEDFFSNLSHMLSDADLAFDDRVLQEWLNTFNEIVIDGKKITRSDFLNGDYLNTLKTDLSNVSREYERLARSLKEVKTAEGEGYAATINQWRSKWADIYSQYNELKQKEVDLSNTLTTLNNEITRAKNNGEEARVNTLQQEYNNLTIQIQSVQKSLQVFLTQKNVTESWLTEQNRLYQQAVANMDNYNNRLAITQDRMNQLSIKKSDLERRVSMVQELMRAYNELQTSVNNEYKNVYDWYKKIMPDMAERIELERQYREELEAGSKDASFNKRIGELELEKKELQERIELNKKAIHQMEADSGPNMTGIDMQKYTAAYEQIVKDMQALAENQISIEEEMYARRTELFNRYWDNVNNGIEEENGQLEILMNERKNILYLGADTYDTQLDELETQKHFLDEKLMALESYHEQGLMNELEYQEQLKQLNQEYAELNVQIEQEKSNRKLKIAQTYYNGIKSITNAISGILSEQIEAEENNKEKQKELRIAQTWMTGIMGSIEALVSGIQSGIPAPGNFILGGVLSAATIVETAMAARNIQNETQQTSGATNINVPTYETLAYETNSEINGNIRDQRVYVVESDIQETGSHVDTVESEAQF